MGKNKDAKVIELPTNPALAKRIKVLNEEIAILTEEVGRIGGVLATAMDVLNKLLDDVAEIEQFGYDTRKLTVGVE